MGLNADVQGLRKVEIIVDDGRPEAVGALSVLFQVACTRAAS